MSFNIFLKTQLKRDQSTPLFSLEFIICHFIVGLALGVGYSNLAVAEVSNLASEYRIAVSTHLEDTYSENSFLNSSQQTVYQADTLLLDVDWVKSETQVIQFQASIISQLTPKSWYLARDEKGEPVLQINSEPLEQNAYDFSVKWIDYLDKSIRKWGFEFVEKQDLSALLIEYGKSYQFSQSHRTLGLKASIETVNIKPETIGGSEPRFSSKYNDTLKLDLNFSQVINAKMLMNMGILLAFQSGYLSDPYLLTAVYVSELNDGDLALAQDTRPNSRVSTILSLGLRKNILSNAQSAHLGYEFYSDKGRSRNNFNTLT